MHSPTINWDSETIIVILMHSWDTQQWKDNLETKKQSSGMGFFATVQFVGWS